MWHSAGMARLRITIGFEAGALNSSAEAIFYSIDTISTLGASGVVLERHWQMVGERDAIDRMLLLGISTAYQCRIIGHLWPTGASETVGAGRAGKVHHRTFPAEICTLTKKLVVPTAAPPVNDAAVERVRSLPIG